MCGEHHSMIRQGEPLVIGPIFLRMNSSERTGSVRLTLNINLLSHVAFFECY